MMERLEEGKRVVEDSEDQWTLDTTVQDIAYANC